MLLSYSVACHTPQLVIHYYLPSPLPQQSLDDCQVTGRPRCHDTDYHQIFDDFSSFIRPNLSGYPSIFVLFSDVQILATMMKPFPYLCGEKFSEKFGSYSSKAEIRSNEVLLHSTGTSSPDLLSVVPRIAFTHIQSNSLSCTVSYYASW